MHRTLVGMSLLALAAGASVAIHAGGWAVVTLRDVPLHATAGRALTIDYAVRQHGVTLLSGLEGSVEARCGDRVVRAKALPLGEPGNYRATVTLPEPGGACSLTVSSGFNGQHSPPVAVRALKHGDAVPPMKPAAVGRQLFAGKGCATCHAHPAVAGDSFPVGPDLEGKPLDARRIAAVLSRRAPAGATKTEEAYGDMPDLGLRHEEIAALTAFLVESTGAPVPAP
jgi:hypothetical protein